MRYFLSASVYESLEEVTFAAKNYLELAKQINSVPYLKKAASLFDEPSNPFVSAQFLEMIDRNWLSDLAQDPYVEKILLQKDAIRMEFESVLANLAGLSQIKTPTCFICFAFENDVKEWLESTLIPDLSITGVRPLYCSLALEPGNELENFHSLIRSADQVIVVCTPLLKEIYDEKFKAQTGVVQQIKIICERFHDKDKYGTVYPIYFKGDKSSSCPSVFLEPIEGASFRATDTDQLGLFSYYSHAIELFGTMRGILRKTRLQLRDRFIDKTEEILSGKIDQENVEAWRNNLTSRRELLFKDIANLVSDKTQIVNLPLPPPHFTGRLKELEELHQTCQAKTRVALTGLGGVGKTALVLKYAEEKKAFYQFIHFMPSGTSQLITDGLLKLADDLHVPKSQKVEERLAWLKTALERREGQYLLIFDGIDQVEAFYEAEKYLPERGNCLLLTSRMPEQSKIRKFETIELKPFTIEEAIDYLLAATGSKEKAQTRILAQKLGMLPLALTHAAGYIRSRKISVERYNSNFNRCEFELFEDKYLNLTKEEKTILTTWKISIDAIEEELKSPLGKEMLEFFAFLGQAPIPLALAEGWCDVAYPKLSRLKLEIALEKLLGYSMIGSSHSDTYNVHLLVQSVICFQMTEKKQQEVYGQAFEVTLQMMEKLNQHDVATWNQAKLCMPHGMTLLERKELMNGVAFPTQWHLVNTLEGIFNILGDFRQALEFCKNYLVVAEQWLQTCPNLKESHHAVATSYSNTAATYDRLENYKEALDYYQKASNIRLKVADENHSDVGIGYNNIGSVHSKLGNHKEALKNCKKALRICVNALGEKHPAVAACYNNIGNIHRRRGNYQKALKHHEQALNIKLEALGENHPDVAWSRNNIGAAYHRLGDYKKASDHHKKALNVVLKTLDENHPDLASIYLNLGSSYQSREKFDKALKYHQNALKIHLQAFGESHSNVAVSYNNVGTLHFKLNDYTKALEQFQKAQKILLQVFGENHVTVAQSNNNLGMIYAGLKDYEKAEKHYQEALKIQLQFLGEDHPDVAVSYHNIGSLYDNRRNPKQALDYYQKALKIQLQALGENHPDVAGSYTNIGSIYKDSCDFIKALEHFQNAFVIFCKVYKQHHPNITNVLGGLIVVAKKLQPCQLNALGAIYPLCVQILGVEDEMTQKLNQLISSKNLFLLSEFAREMQKKNTVKTNTMVLTCLQNDENCLIYDFHSGKVPSEEDSEKSIISDFKDCTWNPNKSIDDLLQVLKKNGPIAIGGQFGKHCYEKPPIEVDKNQLNKIIRGWSRNAKRVKNSQLHFVFIVGAVKVKSLTNAGGYIFFVDPLDPNNPKYPEKDVLYKISYQNLKIHTKEGLIAKINTFVV